MNNGGKRVQSNLDEVSDALAGAFADQSSLERLAGYVFGLRRLPSTTDSADGGEASAPLPDPVYALPDGTRIELDAPSLIELAHRGGDIPSLLLVATEMRPKDERLARAAASWDVHTETELQARLSAISRFRDPRAVYISSLRVCLVEIDGCAFGTGFLVAPDLVITNWHVVDSVLTSHTPKTVPPDRVTFRFDYRPMDSDVSPGTTYKPATGDNVAAFSPEQRLDYVLIRVAGDPGTQPPFGRTDGGLRGWIRVTRFTLNIAACGYAYLNQHPGGKPMVYDDGVLLSRYLFDDRKLLYQIETERGSSGSPCILFDGRLLALHRGAREDGNEGVFFPAIAEHCLKEFNVDLFGVPAPPATGFQDAELLQVTDAKRWRGPIREYLKIAPELVRKLAIARGYVHPSAQVSRRDGNNEPVTDLVEWVLAACRTTATADSLWLILGGYGSGKSSLLQIVGEVLAKQSLESEMATPIPIYCRLDACRGRDSLPAGISYFLSRYGIKVESDALRELFNDRQRQVVLLLDGLDEFVERVDYSRLSEALQLIWDVRGSAALRVVLTCRDTFFPSEDDVAIARADHVVRLEPFNTDQIRQYLRLWTPSLDTVWSVIDGDDYLRKVCQSPMHLFLFCNYYCSLSDVDQLLLKEGKAKARRIDLYRSFVRETLGADTDVARLWSIADRMELLKKLAFKWHDDGITEWSESELRDFIVSCGAGIAQGLDQHAIQKRTRSIFNCSFFVRIEDRFRFTHKSFQEYFIALGLVDEIKSKAFSKWQTPLYNEIYFFGAELLRPDRTTLEAVFASGQLRTQGNFLATVYNVSSPDIDQVLRREAELSQWATVRQVAVQGLGYRDATRPKGSPEEAATAATALVDDVRTAMRAYRKENNTVIRATLRRVISWALTKKPEVASDELAEAENIVVDTGPFKEADARDILNLDIDSRIIPLYRRAMMQSDARWPSVIGGIYLLSIIQDAQSLAEMKQVVARSAHPEIHAAYDECATWRHL